MALKLLERIFGKTSSAGPIVIYKTNNSYYVQLPNGNSFKYMGDSNKKDRFKKVSTIIGSMPAYVDDETRYNVCMGNCEGIVSKVIKKGTSLVRMNMRKRIGSITTPVRKISILHGNLDDTVAAIEEDKNGHPEPDKSRQHDNIPILYGPNFHGNKNPEEYN
ncbi:hypothetical protein J4231_00775 [Candidatus Woesearchaeota archaeon]|nr:hypothetical protein [Candidatus Woesearchaeota archaeon]